MAQRVEIVLEDDLDGSEAAETVVFALDGTSYEIDLNDKNAAALRDALSVYVGHARKVSPGRRAGARSGSSRSKSDAGEIRAWPGAAHRRRGVRGPLTDPGGHWRPSSPQPAFLRAAAIRRWVFLAVSTLSGM
jgi:hypothetical protein